MHEYPGSELTWDKQLVKVKSEFLNSGLIGQLPHRTCHEYAVSPNAIKLTASSRTGHLLPAVRSHRPHCTRYTRAIFSR